ncbi:MAG TPA: cytochrome b N-terminal domain-containing protein [Gemmataceae bacterium]|nr:cytochrome b N-terminal domain-containing protein [Gemmataceae bacterium]
MFSILCAWLDQRTGYKKILDALLLEHIPGGAKWRYVWGSCLAFVFMLQLVTGLLLMTAYSPGDSTAWGSVYFIQYEMEFGWLIRGLHHFGSQAMVVLLGLHMLQVVIAGAHLPPREINWWLGLALMGAILGLSLTGYLLPWDQKGFWATQVATSIAGNLPGIGSFVKRVLVGGPEYGNHTLTRFYALHVGVLPPLIIVLLVMHIAIFRRHGVTAPKDAEGEVMFWPDQAFKDLLACLAIFGVLLGLVVFGGQGNAQEHGAPTAESSLYDQAAYAGKTGCGANLDAPADPQEQYPARPEWYFLFLFQLLKYFQGDQILIGTVIIPNGVGVILFLLPLFGYGKMRPLGHLLGVLVVVAVLTGAASLTCLAIADDTPDPLARKLLEQLAFVALPALAGVLIFQLGLLALLPRGGFRSAVFAAGATVLAVLGVGIGSAVYGAVTDTIPEQVRVRLAEHVTEKKDEPSEMTKKATGFRKQVAHAEENAHRAVQIAHAGIPEGGAALLLRRDPMTAGKKLFVQHCGSCHSYQGVCDTEPFQASDLTNFGSKEWIRSMLTNAGDKRFFGRTKLDGMKGWSENYQDIKDPAQKIPYEAWMDRVTDWLAGHPTGQPKADPKTPEEIKFKQGYDAFFDKKISKGRCYTCHTYDGKGSDKGPDLTGYGSAEWLRLMIIAPAHPSRHGKENAMTAFRPKDGPGAEILLHELAVVAGDKYSPLSDVDRELIIRFMLHDDRVVFFGQPVSGPPPAKKQK